jgi:hypothetical protein
MTMALADPAGLLERAPVPGVEFLIRPSELPAKTRSRVGPIRAVDAGPDGAIEIPGE